MKFTLMGFSQQGLINLGMDAIDAMLLRYFVDFKATNKMKFEMIEDKLFFWVNYDNVLKEFPILNMKKRTIQTRFLKLRDAGVLTHYLKKDGGTYSFFGIGDKYEELIAGENNKEEEEIEQGQDKGEGSSLSEHPSSLEGQGSQSKLLTNNPSTKDSSTKNNITSSRKRGCETKEKEISEIIDYLNKATGKKFKPDTKVTERYITVRLKEGFTLEDFKAVIDNMVYNWTGTRFQQYLAPSTLFGSKFETYLHGGKVHKEKGLSSGKDEYQPQGRGFRGKGSTGLKQGNVAPISSLSHSENKEKTSGAEGKAADLTIIFGEDM
ncbi:conserved phage C-terminal domain-containing protein [Clostridium culturomicium]|uniref:conserved phage C-terminal domain-containing protein n=1 Tax=Clostridium culturomicium TaxID=1499683 RepID=UPI0038578888